MNKKNLFYFMRENLVWFNLVFRLMIIIGLAFSFLFGCSIPYTVRYNVKETEMFGVWYIDLEHCRFAKTDLNLRELPPVIDGDEAKKFLLTLNSDGTFQIADMPTRLLTYAQDNVNDEFDALIENKYIGCWGVSSRPFLNDYVTIEGRWKISTFQTTTTVAPFSNEKVEEHEIFWIDLVASGYNFDPWLITTDGIFAPEAPFDFDGYRGIAFKKQKND